MDERKSRTIDEYIAAFPEDVRGVLEKFRLVIKKNAPLAQETISYGMPTFKLQGNLVHFAAYKQHIGFYPTPSAIEAFKNELGLYQISKGAVRFPLGSPVPLDLVARMVKFRVDQVAKKVR